MTSLIDQLHGDGDDAGDEPAAAATTGRVPLPVGLPMPKDAALLDPATPRVRVRTVETRFPFPVPNGWFAVARGADLEPGAVTARTYFGRDLVLWRTDAGEARLADAYCPHQGAHLAVGGRVAGDSLRCPFHGWSFSGPGGACTEIPYAPDARIPSRARLRTYPVIERHGLVWAWHHLEDGEPFYELPTIPELDDPEWQTPRLIDFHVATTCQEMAENNHDFAHFKYVHGSETVPEGTERIEGTYKHTENENLVRETFGLGLGCVRVPNVVTFLSSVTPVDTEHVHVRWLFTSPVSAGEGMVDAMAENFAAGVSQDLPIWENKIFRARPLLVRGEGGIMAHRRWSAQFYSAEVELPDAPEADEGDAPEEGAS
jgi:phenylpropionate dioxygenase-like ring-hydroxylating dioxygenase large terminal subunit